MKLHRINRTKSKKEHVYLLLPSTSPLLTIHPYYPGRRSLPWSPRLLPGQGRHLHLLLGCLCGIHYFHLGDAHAALSRLEGGIMGGREGEEGRTVETHPAVDFSRCYFLFTPNYSPT